MASFACASGSKGRGWRGAGFWFASVLAVLALAGAWPVAAQTSTPPRRSTGRHLPPARQDPAAKDLSFPVYREPQRWSVSFGAGLLSGNDLFKVVFPTPPATWVLPSGLVVSQPHSLRVTLDEDLLLAGSVSYHLPPRWQVRCDLGWSEVDATAEVKDLQTVTLHPYDRISFFSAALAGECRLTTTRSYPFVQGGVALLDVGARSAAGLDQTALAWRLGLGFHWGFRGGWGLRAEVRDTIRQLDLAEHGELAFTGLDYREAGPQHLYELSLQVRTGL